MPEEVFEIFDETGRLVGRAPRRQVHASGWWHRSVHVFLFRSDGALYIQRRAGDKDLYPGRWDFSVGEHLKPGETYLEAAYRGLREELDIVDAALEPLGAIQPYQCDVPALGIADHELQLSYRGTCTGSPRPDGIEVAEVRALAATDLHAWITQAPEAFTPWFLHELRTRPGLGAFALART